MRKQPRAHSETLTRGHIVAAVEDGFGPHGASRSDLLEAAVVGGAGPGVIEALNRLPDRQFPTMGHLWEQLSDVPVDWLTDE